MATDKIIISKKKAMQDFFGTYSGIERELSEMTSKELVAHLESDIFIQCASAATGIGSDEFVKFAPSFFNSK